MATFFYLLLRVAATTLGLCATAYSAWTSWEHFHNLLGPLAAISAAAMLIFCEHAARDRQWVHFGLLALLGITAAVISSSVVLQRNADTQARTLQGTMSSNLAKVEAQKALAEAKDEIAKAEAAASKECGSGRGPRCGALESREREARQRLAETRSKVVGLGAAAAVNPVANVMGGWAETFNRAMAVAPAIWLELAAPALLAFGFAPWPRKGPSAEVVALRTALDTANGEIGRLKKALKAARQKNKGEPRKPPAVPRAVAKPQLKVVN
jgi:hypothetical protein